MSCCSWKRWCHGKHTNKALGTLYSIRMYHCLTHAASR
jgi:hypothetical protein